MTRTDRKGMSTTTFVVAACAAAVFGVIWYAASRPWSGFSDLSVGECLERDGVIVDTLGGEFQYEQGDFLGDVRGLSCPCVCIDREGLARARSTK
jgi:hypothetical protein